jgi:hypothetical protein
VPFPPCNGGMGTNHTISSSQTPCYPTPMVVPWSDLELPDTDFDVAALHAAIEERRTARSMTWTAVAREVNRSDERYDVRPISPSTISGLKNKRWGVEGDGVLQMLLWLDRAPESFVRGHPGATHPDARLPRVTGGQVLRFDVPSIYSRLDTQRSARELTWAQAAAEIGGLYNAETLKNMSRQQRTGFPHVMRLARWLHCPAAALTRIALW